MKRHAKKDGKKLKKTLDGITGLVYTNEHTKRQSIKRKEETSDAFNYGWNRRVMCDPQSRR